MAVVPTLPFRREHPLLPAPRLLRIQHESPVLRVRTQAGDEAWLITRYKDVKRLLHDARLGRSHPDPQKAGRVRNSAVLNGPKGDHRTEDLEHTRLRHLLIPEFSARRIRVLAPLIEDEARKLLAAMIGEGSPGDLHEKLSVPLSVRTISALLGVPFEDRGSFTAWSQDIAGTEDAAAAAAAWEQLNRYMLDLVERKHAAPGDDLISDLISGHPELDRGHLAEIGSLLLFAGHDTTISRIDVAAVLVLGHSCAREAARDESVLAAAVEEAVRRSTSGSAGVPRYARSDIRLHGTTINAGDTVLLSLGAANHDPRAYPEPETFRPGRTDPPHLTFGHGPRHCIGAGLARTEVHIALRTALREVPTLRLAVPPEELTSRPDHLGGGLARVPVAW